MRIGRLLRVTRLLSVALLRIGGLLRISTISGRGRRLGRISLLRLLAVTLLRLFLIGSNAEALDRREHSAVVLSAIDAGIDVDTLARLEIVKEAHLIAGELH